MTDREYRRSRTTRWGTSTAPRTSSASAPSRANAGRLLDQVGRYISELRAIALQRFAMKPLVSLGFRLALREVKAHARAEGFDPELEDELRVFQRAFEARIMYRI